mgnify:CR=1 FL=1
MIYCLFHAGSGLGDMLHRYITVRTFAEEKGYKFGALGEFKGDFFLNQPNIIPYILTGYKQWREKDVRDPQNGDIRSYDPEINFVEDNTVIDGSFEDSKYWGHNLKNISEWLKVEPLEVPDDLCIVGFRGGEYAAIPDLFLTKEYYEEAIREMREINKDMRFQVHTDDPVLAREYFPDFEIVENDKISHSKHTNMAFNWGSARYAKYAIIPNSAFFILPRLLKHFEDPTAVTVAPRYWAGRNTGVWKRPACYYSCFFYV